MEYLALGTTSFKVSRIGLGTVQLGLPYDIGLPPPPAAAECIRLLRAAHDAGITYFDTAAVYGRSEELVGKAFAGVAKKPVLATKVGLRGGPEGTPLAGAALRRHLEESVTNSLRLLAVERLDLLQIHSVVDDVLPEELPQAMADLQGGGLVRHWGASTYGEAGSLAVLAHAGLFRTLQVAYNLLDRRMGKQVLPRCRELGVGRILRSVFLKGVLSNRARQLPKHLAALQAAALKAEAVASDMGISLPELAFRFAVFSRHADVTLFGTASQEELEGNLKAVAAGPLPPDATAALDRLQVRDPELLNPSAWGF